MKIKPDEQLFATLQQCVNSTLRQWLDENKVEVLGVFRKAVHDEAAKNEQTRRGIKPSGFLTVNEVASRWRLHPESVRRMMRDGRVPRVMVGRQSRISLRVVEAFETDGKISKM